MTIKQKASASLIKWLHFVHNLTNCLISTVSNYFLLGLVELFEKVFHCRMTFNSIIINVPKMTSFPFGKTSNSYLTVPVLW